jgi:hypothetical protein
VTWESEALAPEELELDEVFTRILENLGGRIGGPFALRLVLQPLVATVLAVRGGLADDRRP